MKKYILILALIQSQIMVSQKENDFHNRGFWKTNPSIQTIEEKIKEGNNVAALTNRAFDATTYALLEKVDNKTIKHLLTKKGNGVNKLTHDGRTYIFWAAYMNNLEMMRHLVSMGAKTNINDNHGNSILNFSATTGQTNQKIYDYLFSMNANIKTEKNHSGANALLLVAPHLKDLKLADYLISKGASLKDKDYNGNGFFEYAVKGGNIQFLKEILKKGVHKGKNAMIFASQGLRRKKNKLETYQFLEEEGVSANVIDEKGRNPLHSIAYTDKNLATYNYFISKGVRVDLQDKEGYSPFMNAANSNNLEIVEFLSKRVKNINAKNENGHSALAMAVNRNSIEVVQFLIESGADINTKDKSGNTLSYLVLNNYKTKNTKPFEEKLALLQENGFIFNEIQNAGNTLLHIATERNNISLLKRLSSFDIDLNSKNDAGLSALQIAAMKAKDDKIIKYLLSIGADKSVKTDFDETVFNLASENELLKKSNTNISFLK
jgi:ankyrin repeat protein